MTLILSLANSRQVIQLSDRRLTSLGNGRLPRAVLSDSANKAGFFEVGDARLVFGFTGLATTSGPSGLVEFETATWLSRALIEAAQPNFAIEGAVERLKLKLSDVFRVTPSIRALNKSARRLSVMLSGFWYTGGSWIPAGWIVTNFQRRFDPSWLGNDLEKADDKFTVWRWHQSVPASPEPYVLVQRIGQWSSVPETALEKLRSLLKKDIPAAGLTGAALRIMREASELNSSAGTVGKHISIVTIYRDEAEPPCFSEEADVVTDDVTLPTVLVARHAGMIGNLSVSMGRAPGDAYSSPSILPRVRKSAPCPCNSGRRYAECHRRTRHDVVRT